MMLMEFGRRNKWRAQAFLCLQMDVKSVLPSSKLGWLQLLTYAILVPAAQGRLSPVQCWASSIIAVGQQRSCRKEHDLISSYLEAPILMDEHQDG